MRLEIEAWIMALAITVAMPMGMGMRYKVGDSVWSIPLSPDFYSLWSSSFLFLVGDSLEFEFESEFFNVIQVPRLDYDSCTSWAPIKILTVSPAIVLLNDAGVFYYICNISNDCDLGQKITIVVHDRLSPAPAPSAGAPTLTLAPAPLAGAPTPPLEPTSSAFLDSPMAPSPVLLNTINQSWYSDANIIGLGFVSIWVTLGWALIS